MRARFGAIYLVEVRFQTTVTENFVAMTAQSRLIRDACQTYDTADLIHCSRAVLQNARCTCIAVL